MREEDMQRIEDFICTAIGQRPRPGKPLREAVANLLRDYRMYKVLYEKLWTQVNPTLPAPPQRGNEVSTQSEGRVCIDVSAGVRIRNAARHLLHRAARRRG